MTRWTIEKSDGFTDVGLLRISESVRAYLYSVTWQPGGQVARAPSDNFLGALKSKGGIKFAISNVKYLTKYVKSCLSTNSKW